MDRRDVRHSAHVVLNPLLTLVPRAQERQFWRSCTYQQASKRIDSWSLYMTLLAHALYARWQAKLDSKERFKLLYTGICLMIAFSQLLWAKLRPESYLRWRTCACCSIRIFKFLVFCNVPNAVRWMIKEQHLEAELFTAVEGSLHLSGTVALIKQVVMMSGTTQMLLHALIHPLPFIPTLFLQLAYLILLILLGLEPSVHLLSNQQIGLRNLCHDLNLGLQMASSCATSLPLSIEHFDSHCRSHSSRLLVLFSLTYIGFLVPVLIAYRMEKGMKCTFLRSLDQDARANPAVQTAQSSSTSLLALHWTDIGTMLCLAMCSWFLILQFHEGLTRFTYPL